MAKLWGRGMESQKGIGPLFMVDKEAWQRVAS